MLKKELTVPGSKVKILDKISGGLIGSSDDQSLPYVRLMFEPGACEPGATVIQGHSGDILTIQRKPRRIYGINVVEVHRLGDPRNYYVYWCELRASCDHV